MRHTSNIAREEGRNERERKTHLKHKSDTIMRGKKTSQTTKTITIHFMRRTSVIHIGIRQHKSALVLVYECITLNASARQP